MREIEFRAWCKPNNNMQKVSAVYAEGKAIALEDLQTYVSSEFELMQYTGLKDKNGVNIFEGDIVVIEYSPTQKENPKIVEYEEEDGAFRLNEFRNLRLYCQLPCSIDWIDKLVVIGNIYENPELLGENNASV